MKLAEECAQIVREARPAMQKSMDEYVLSRFEEVVGRCKEAARNGCCYVEVEGDWIPRQPGVVIMEGLRQEGFQVEESGGCTHGHVSPYRLRILWKDSAPTEYRLVRREGGE